MGKPPDSGQGILRGVLCLCVAGRPGVRVNNAAPWTARGRGSSTRTRCAIGERRRAFLRDGFSGDPLRMRRGFVGGCERCGIRIFVFFCGNRWIGLVQVSIPVRSGFGDLGDAEAVFGGIFHAPTAITGQLPDGPAPCPSSMAPSSKHSAAREPVKYDCLEDAVGGLADEVHTLADQIEVLRVAIDDLRAEVEFALRNLARPAWAPTEPLTSMPRDPLADPFPINRTRREDVPPAPRNMAPPPFDPPAPPPNTDAGLGELF